MEQQEQVHISQRYRWIENAHILLWLVKDTFWSMEWKPGGIFMILPTLAVAFFLLWKSRGVRSEFFHNIAVCFWILANSAWMLGEFFGHESRPYAAALFICGLLSIAFYYSVYFRKDKKKEKEYVLETAKVPSN